MIGKWRMGMIFGEAISRVKFYKSLGLEKEKLILYNRG